MSVILISVFQSTGKMLRLFCYCLPFYYLVICNLNTIMYGNFTSRKLDIRCFTVYVKC